MSRRALVIDFLEKLRMNQVQFSVAAHAAWAPNLVTQQEWLNWANCPVGIQGSNEPGVLAMSSLLRRRAGFLGKMALEVAYACLSDRENERDVTPTVFCSRHGDVARQHRVCHLKICCKVENAAASVGGVQN